MEPAKQRTCLNIFISGGMFANITVKFYLFVRERLRDEKHEKQEAKNMKTQVNAEE